MTLYGSRRAPGPEEMKGANDNSVSLEKLSFQAELVCYTFGWLSFVMEG